MSKRRLSYRHRRFDAHRRRSKTSRRRVSTGLSSEDGINEYFKDEAKMTTPIIRSLKEGIRFNSVAPLLSTRAKRIANRIVSHQAHNSISGKYGDYKIIFVPIKLNVRSKNSTCTKRKNPNGIQRNIMWIRAKDGRLHRKRERITSKIIGISRWVVEVTDTIQDAQISDRHSTCGSINNIPHQHYFLHR